MNQFGDTEHFDAEEYLSTDSEDDSGVGVGIGFFRFEISANFIMMAK